MNARERYLAVFNNEKRKKLDNIPTHVQYVREEFINLHWDEIMRNYNRPLFDAPYFDAPLALGFDAVFAGFPPSVQFRTIKIEDRDGNRFRIRESGEPLLSDSNYYQGGYIDSIDILNKFWTKLKRIDRSDIIRKTISRYEKMAPSIFPVLMVDGIFDRVWKAMGMANFSRNFRKKTKLYRELIKFYAEITKINIEGLIEATGGRSKILNILDDVAFKGRLMISPERWNQDFLPCYKKLNSMISDAGLIPQTHSDGDITELIPSLQKAGFRGLQGWEGECDPFYINDNFPDFVVIGFGDVSDVLPFGNPELVDSHVKNLMDAFKENRHFILGPSTVIFKEIPLENIKTFMNAAKKYGGY